MQNMLVLNAEGPEVRVAVVEEGQLAEFFVERKRDKGMVGNIYRGKVSRVLPGMQAAFVNLGPKVERDAFLYVADVLGSGEERKLFEDAEMTEADDDEEVEVGETGKPKGKARKLLASRKMEDLLRPGDTVLCQVTKDPIGLKGARVTGHVSLSGRYSVFMPHVPQIGVSRRIGSDKERRRLRDIVNAVRPKGTGFIVRTAAEDAIDQELRDDVDFLANVWGEIDRRAEESRGPGLVYADLDLALRCIRDLMREDTSEVIIDDEEQYERIKKFTMAFLPRFAERVKRYEQRRPVFDHYHIEPALRQAVARRVPLRSGGSLVIDQGEALTAIDINTGSFTNTGSGNLEDTVTANNLEACEEVARQLRLRNIGGIIVIDFVDMDKEGNRRKVWDAFHKALMRDRARTNVTKISELGLVEMTRKRTRESLVQLLTEPCPTCEGAGVVKSVQTVAYELCARSGAAARWSTTTASTSRRRRAWPRCCRARSAITSIAREAVRRRRSRSSRRRAGSRTSIESRARCRRRSRRKRPRRRRVPRWCRARPVAAAAAVVAAAEMRPRAVVRQRARWTLAPASGRGRDRASA